MESGGTTGTDWQTDSTVERFRQPGVSGISLMHHLELKLAHFHLRQHNEVKTPLIQGLI